MTKHYRIVWWNDWAGCLTRPIDLRLLEVSTSPVHGVALCLVVLGLGFTVYRLPDAPDVYGDGGVA